MKDERAATLSGCAGRRGNHEREASVEIVNG
jgi:hypothetical protein